MCLECYLSAIGKYEPTPTTKEYPIHISSSNGEELLVVQTKPEYQIRFKGKEITSFELVSILEKAGETPTTLSAKLQREADMFLAQNPEYSDVRRFYPKLHAAIIESMTNFALSSIAQRIAREATINEIKSHYRNCLLQPIAYIGNVEKQKYWKEFLAESIEYLNAIQPNAPVGKSYISVEEADKKTKTLVESIEELLPMARFSYEHSKRAGAHQENLSDDREILQKAMDILTQFKSTKEEGGNK